MPIERLTVMVRVNCVTVMELAHAEARRLVDEGDLTPELHRFVQARWQDQFGLIEIG